MILGDPHKFAILIDKVPAWSVEGSFNNGLFHYIIDGNFLPEAPNVATLGADIMDLKSDTSFLSMPEDKDLFEMEKTEAFKSMLRRMLPLMIDADSDVSDDFEPDFTFRASTSSLEDAGCFVFAVLFNSEVRILGANVAALMQDEFGRGAWASNAQLTVHEARLGVSEMSEIVSTLLLPDFER